MRKVFVLFHLLLACGMLSMVAGQQLPTDRGTVARCVTDEAGAALRKAYPNGVPGRRLPSPMKVEQVDEHFTYYIPVIVHIMHAYGAEMNVSVEQIESQIRIMNEGFGRYGQGYNEDPVSGIANVKFCLAQVDPDGNPTPGYEYVESQFAVILDPFTQDTMMKRINIWDPNRYLNIWTVREIQGNDIVFRGYTYIPEEVAGTVWDGIVVNHESFGTFPYGTSTSYGTTCVHEAGHYLGLYHPWGPYAYDDCADGTDLCDDTPPVYDSYFADPPECAAPAACDGQPRQTANYMDYAADLCQNLFTQCQVARMLDNLITYRADMVNSKNMLSTGCGSYPDSIPSFDSIYVYPIPATSHLTINVDIVDAGPARVELIDFAGRSVYQDAQASFGRGPIQIDVSQLSLGLYTLRVSTSKAEIWRRIKVGD